MREPRHLERCGHGNEYQVCKDSGQPARVNLEGEETCVEKRPPDSERKARSQTQVASRLLAIAFVGFLFLVCFPHAVWGEDSGSALGTLNLTPQNEKIAVFCSSWGEEPMGTHLGNILGREVESFTLGATNAGGALASCSRYKDNKFGIIVTDFGSHDRVDNLPWEVTEADLRQLFQTLKDSGAIVVYNELVLESYGFPYGEVCREEGVILVPNITEGIMSPESTVGSGMSGIVLDPRFFAGDSSHPSNEGYSVMAERTAKVLLDTGLVQSAQTCVELSEQIPAVLSRAMELINAVAEKGADTQLAMKHYDLAEYLHENRFCYTANWSLRERIIVPLESVLAGWDEITGIFDAANTSITMIEEGGMSREAILMKADYSRAQKAWGEYDSGTTRLYLDKVLVKGAEFPEPALLSILGSAVLFALSRSRLGRIS